MRVREYIEYIALVFQGFFSVRRSFHPSIALNVREIHC